MSDIVDIFEKNNIEDLDDRIYLLRQCMGVLDVSDIGGNNSIDDAYTDEVNFFIDGMWRLLK